MKNAMGAAKLAAAAADTFAAAAQKAEKGLPAASAKVIVAAKGAAAAAVEGRRQVRQRSLQRDRCRHQGPADGRRQARQGAATRTRSPRRPSSARRPLADGKNLAALMRKSIALLRTPKGSPMPIKFMVLFNKANPKDLRLYLGPKPESGLAKLKTQFASDVKVNRVKDPKGKVIWEKGALTFMSDILKGGLAKQIQLSIRQQTKVTVKVRVKRSSGEVDEADAKDVSDDELALSPAEEAAMLAGGKEWESGLKELDSAIQAALKGPKADAGQEAGRRHPFRRRLRQVRRGLRRPRRARLAAPGSRRRRQRRQGSRVRHPDRGPGREGGRSGDRPQGQVRRPARQDRRGDRAQGRRLEGDQAVQGRRRAVPEEGGQDLGRERRQVRHQDRAAARQRGQAEVDAAGRQAGNRARQFRQDARHDDQGDHPAVEGDRLRRSPPRRRRRRR